MFVLIQQTWTVTWVHTTWTVTQVHTACTVTRLQCTARWKLASTLGKEKQVRCQEALSVSSIHKIPYIPPESIKDKLLIFKNPTDRKLFEL